MVSTTACGRPLKSAASRPGATHESTTDLDAGAIWCRAPEKGGPSSEECAREGLSRGEWVRETRSGWARTARPDGPAPHPPWPCTVSVRAGSLGEMHTCIEPEASCVPVRPCRGGPRSGRNTAGSGRTRGKQTGLPELPRIDSRSAGSSRDGVAILQGKCVVVRAHRPHDWAPPECGQRVAIWATCDSRGGDGGRAVTCGVIVYLPSGWCTTQPQCCPYGPTHACLTAVAKTAARPDALPTALGSWCAKAVEAPSRAPRLPARCM